MPREKLREAIGMYDKILGRWKRECLLYDQKQGTVGGCVHELFPDEMDSLIAIMAAARAYACERCGGHGLDYDAVDMPYACPDCADYRKIADGGE
jgi:DNA-directed RNA polymerase subunit RPC12/RpoP